MLQNQLLFLVDDDMDDHEIFKSALAKVDEDLTLLTASTLPDYIFVDLNMPRMDGLQFLKEIKQTDALKNIPVIIYSTSSSPGDIVKTKQLGAVLFVTKPSRFSDLCSLLQSLIRG
jgi:CheY-like chemotaxis protein